MAIKRGVFYQRLLISARGRKCAARSAETTADQSTGTQVAARDPAYGSARARAEKAAR